jgi:hypothetical protein
VAWRAVKARRARGVVAVVGGVCHASAVDVTARMIEEIPRGNLRVPREEFAAVWSAAEQIHDRLKAQGKGDWYVTGVVITCRWLGCATTVFNYPHGPKAEPTDAPITNRSARAHEELIEAETLAAELEAIRHPEGIKGEPGWLEAVVATLNWAWRGSGVPPLDVGQAAVG